MMKLDKYAIIKTGGKQYIVWENCELDIEKIDKKEGKKVVFDKVLLLKNKKLKIGKPFLKKVKVEGKVIEQFKDKKIRVAIFKAKSRYRRVKGHRQRLTKVKINKISS